MDGITIGDATHGVDDYGDYGSILDDEEDNRVPEPIDLMPPPPPGVVIDDDSDRHD